MKNLLTFNYWLNLHPENLTLGAQKLFLGFIIGLVALAVITAWLKRRGGIYRGFFKRLYAFCLANVIIGAIFLFFNYEAVPFFSARFWLGLWALVMLAWLIFIINRLRIIPKQKKHLAQEQELKKYLP